ncbi:MAG: hypothetical protein IPL86_15905 [Flavobacteriales bacterium]|nr:hypothetical protein [Flavobacteriales bacterium]
MATLPIEQFGGISPLIEQRKLPPFGATSAVNCVFEGTDLRPLRAPLDVAALAGFHVRLYKYRFQTQSYWLAWPQTSAGTPIVDVVPSPIAQDTLGRLYWTSVSTTGGSTLPRVASQLTQGELNTPTTNTRRLGIPAPSSAPTLSEVQAANSIAGAIQPFTMSQTSPVTVTTTIAHPFADGQRVVVEYLSGAVDGENMAEINGREFLVSVSSSTQFRLVGSDGANYSALTNASQVTIRRVYADSDLEARSYVCTYVSNWGEEGMPCTPTAPTDVRYDSGVSLALPTSIGSPFNTYINRVRIYRAVAGTTQGAQFFYVGEVSITPNVAATFVDTVDPIALGEVLPSADWAMPPAGLSGLTTMPNGFLAGFLGNTLYFSEPYLPHAWPDRYRKTVDSDIVGIAVYGQTLVVATKGQPYIVTGTDPASVSAAKLDVYAPCLSKGGVVAIGNGVAYPSYDGLVLVSSAGVQVVTAQYMTKAQWLAAWDTGMQSVFHDGRIIAMSTNASKPTLIFQLDGGRLNISTTTTQCTTPAIDEFDQLHYTLAQRLWQFDAGSTAMSATWQSRVFTLPKGARNMGVCQVFASGYPVTLTFGYSNLTSELGNPSTTSVIPPASTFTVNVNGSEPVRMPDGFLSREWRIGVTTAHAVQRIIAAETMGELRE